MRTPVILDAYDSPYWFDGSNKIQPMSAPNPITIISDDDEIRVYMGASMFLGDSSYKDLNISLWHILDRCEHVKKPSEDVAYISTNLYVLKMIALYYMNTRNYAGMNVGEFLRRTLPNGETKAQEVHQS